MKHYSRYNRKIKKNKKNIPPNNMWKFLEKFKCSFFACCKSKCSLNVKDIDGDGKPDIIELEIEKEGKNVKFSTEL